MFFDMDFIDLPKFPHYVIIAIVVICLGELIDWLYLQARRKTNACHQMEVYHQKLEHDSFAIERKKLKEELQSVKRIGELLKEFEHLEEQLGDGYTELGDVSHANRLKDLSSELAMFQNKAKELKIINEEICLEKRRLLKQQDGVNDKEFEPSLQELINNINHLEANNQRLEAQLASHKQKLTPNCI